MSNLTRSQLFLCSICILFVFAITLQLGCNDREHPPTGKSAKQLRLESDKAEKEFEAELQKRIEQTEATLKPYRTNGLLKVKLTPGEGEVYIDDGLVTIPQKGLMLPIGTYKVKAVWPDGKQVSKKVFLTPALQQMVSYKWDYSRNSRGGSGNQDSNISFNADLSPTEVNLEKPK